MYGYQGLYWGLYRGYIGFRVKDLRPFGEGDSSDDRYIHRFWCPSLLYLKGGYMGYIGVVNIG